MARKQKYTDEELINAARTLIAESGPRAATVGAIAGRVGAPIGSVYHRFRSRDVILGRVLLDAVEEFQAEYAKVALDGACGAGDLAKHVIDWVRAHPSTARLLTLYRRDEFLADGVPAELAERGARLQREALDISHALCQRWFGEVNAHGLDAVRLAVAELPYGAVRRRLSHGETIPNELSTLMQAAAEAVIARALEVHR